MSKKSSIFDPKFTPDMLADASVADEYIQHYIFSGHGSSHMNQLIVGMVLNILKYTPKDEADRLLKCFSSDPEVMASLERTNNVNPRLTGKFPSRLSAKPN